MKERPILFSAAMVKAILRGRKTQTRRALRKSSQNTIADMSGVDGFRPLFSFEECLFDEDGKEDKPAWVVKDADDSEMVYPIGNPYGVPGDKLWVRETHFLYGLWHRNGKTKSGKTRMRFACVHDRGAKYLDNPPEFIKTSKEDMGWYKRPSIHMPRWASRISLKVQNIRVQRLNKITEEDAAQEGVRAIDPKVFRGTDVPRMISFKEGFEELWDSINAARGLGWDKNPWVWAITFKRVKP